MAHVGHFKEHVLYIVVVANLGFFDVASGHGCMQVIIPSSEHRGSGVEFRSLCQIVGIFGISSSATPPLSVHLAVSLHLWLCDRLQPTTAPVLQYFQAAVCDLTRQPRP